MPGRTTPDQPVRASQALARSLPARPRAERNVSELPASPANAALSLMTEASRITEARRARRMIAANRITARNPTIGERKPVAPNPRVATARPLRGIALIPRPRASRRHLPRTTAARAQWVPSQPAQRRRTAMPTPITRRPRLPATPRATSRKRAAHRTRPLTRVRIPPDTPVDMPAATPGSTSSGRSHFGSISIDRAGLENVD